jgi:hypothetical protein
MPTRPARTTTVRRLTPNGAGPARFSLVGANWEPWQGHSIQPDDSQNGILHPRWGHFWCKARNPGEAPDNSSVTRSDFTAFRSDAVTAMRYARASGM